MKSIRSRKNIPPDGEARQSQVVSMYGPGAIVDLPEAAVIISGLDAWNERGSEIIYEPRLLQLARQTTGVAGLELRSPPRKDDSPRNLSGHIQALRFPEWSIVQKQIPDREAFGIRCRARMLVHFNSVDGKNWKTYRDQDGSHKLVPVRFVMACPHGHLMFSLPSSPSLSASPLDW